MDLTKNFPRSVKDKLAGVVMLARTTDKARAYKAGKLGEYRYDCPMDRAVFALLGIDAEEFANKAHQLGDADLEKWVIDRHVSKKPAAEIDQFNKSFLNHKPEPGSDGEKYFFEMRDSLDPSRTDITTWPQLLDLDEKREVPRAKAA